MKKNLLFTLLILVSGKIWAQSCPEVAQLFKIKDTSLFYSDKVVRFRIPETDYYSLLKLPETKRLQETIQSAQLRLEQAVRDIEAKNYEQASYWLKQSDYQIQYAELLCSDLTFILWKREIKYYESAISHIESDKTVQDSLKTVNALAEKKKLESAKIKATAYENENIVKKDGYILDYSYYGGKKNAEAYMRSMKFGSVSVVGSGSSNDYDYSVPNHATSQKARTQHVSGYTRHSKSGKNTYVKTYKRSSRNSGFSRSYRSRRRK